MPVIKNPTTKAQKQQVVHTEMHKFKEGQLHSGSEHGPKVTNRKQAIAIAMHESGQHKPQKGSAMKHSRKSHGGPNYLAGHAKDHGRKVGFAEHHEAAPSDQAGHKDQPRGNRGTGIGPMHVGAGVRGTGEGVGRSGEPVPHMREGHGHHDGNSVIAHPQHHPGHPNKSGTPGHPHHLAHGGDHGPGHMGRAAGGHEHGEDHHANPHHSKHHPSHPSHPDHPETMANHTEWHEHDSSAKATHHPPAVGEVHHFNRPSSSHAHGFGHSQEQRKGPLRMSGHSGAHRVGHRG